MRVKSFCLVALIFAFSVSAQGQHKGINFQATIKKPDGSYPSAIGINVTVQILDPANDCVLREEVHSGVNVTNGYMNLVIGSSSASTPAGKNPATVLTIPQVMDNATARTGLNCVDANDNIVLVNQTYAPLATHGRKLRIRTTIAGDPIVADLNMRSVPFSVNAENLDGKTASQFIQTSTNTTQAKIDNLLATNVYNNLINLDSTSTSAFLLPAGTTAQRPGGTLGQIRYNSQTGNVEFYNGSAWTAMSNASGAVASVSSTNSYLTVGGTATAPTLTVNVGTAANTVAAGDDSRIVNAVQNAGSTPSIKTGADASKGAAAGGTLYIATDSQKIYRDISGTWSLVTSLDYNDLSNKPFGAGIWADGGSGKIYYNGGNVGIGNTSPQDKLHVSGNVLVDYSSGVKYLDNGGTSRGMLSTGAAPASGGWASEPNRVTLSGREGGIGFTLMGAGKASFDSNGNFLIGGSQKPVNLMDIKGGTAIGSYAGTNAAPTDGLLVSGTVGIGTSSPSAKLDVVSATSGVEPLWVEKNVFGEGSGVRFKNTVSDVSSAVFQGGEGGTLKGNFVFMTGGNAAGTGLTEKMRIMSTGEVGIGTASPNAKLDISNTVQASERMRLSGQEFFQGGITSTDGVSFLLGVNRNNNRQLWLADSASTAVNNSNQIMRFILSGNSAPEISAIATDGTTVKNLALQSGGGNVGIGMTTPSEKLTVEGGTALRELASSPGLTANYGKVYVKTDGNIYYKNAGGTEYNLLAPTAGTATSVSAGNGAVGTPSMSFSGDTDTGFYSNGANTIGITSGGSNVFNISSTTLSSPTTGGALITSGNGTAGAPTFSFAGDSDTGWFRPAADTMAASTAGTERMRIDSSGNVGIGTSNPSVALHVKGDQILSSDTGTRFQIRSYTGAGSGILMFRRAEGTEASPTYVTNGGVLGTLEYRNHTATDGASVTAKATENHSATAAGTSLYFLTVPNTTIVPQTRMVIQQDGNVGIGTTSPNTKLDVNGDISATGFLTVNPPNITTTTGNININSFLTTYAPIAAVTAPNVHSIVNSLVTSGTEDLSSADVAASLNKVSNAINQPVGNFIGTESQVFHNTASTMSSAKGAYGQVINSSTGTITNAFGTYGYVRNPSSGTITNAYGTFGTIGNISTGTISNAYSVYADNPANAGGGTITNFYGVYIATPSSATNNFALYSQGGTNYFGGNVGIGTTSPNSLLTVEGTTALRELASSPSNTASYGKVYVKTDGNIYYKNASGTEYNLLSPTAGTATSVSAGNGAVGTPSVSFSGDTDTGFYSNGANTIGITSGGSNVFNISSTTLSSPTTGGALITSGNGTAGAPTFSFAGDTDTGWFRPAADTMAASTAGTERMRIDSSGNVFIGTSSGGDKLYVGGGRIGLDQNQVLTWRDSSTNDMADISGISVDANNGYMAFRTRKAGVVTEQLRINQSGNVGIGTTNPDSQLHVSKSDSDTTLTVTNSQSSGVHYPGIIVENYDGGQGGHPYVLMQNSNGTKAVPTATQANSTVGALIVGGHNGTAAVQSARIEFNAESAFSPANNPTSIGFHTGYSGSNGSYAERMRISANGNVGIGTTSPGYKLDIADTITGSAVQGYSTTNKSITVSPAANQTIGFGTQTVGDYSSIEIPATNTKTVSIVNGFGVDAINNSPNISLGSLWGGYASSYNTAAGMTLTYDMGGLWSYTENSGNSTIPTMQGGWLGATSKAGTITDLHGAYVETDISGGTVTNAAGLSVVAKQSGGTVTNRYGILLNAPTGTATNDYGIYEAGNQKNYFAGNIGIGTTAPAVALDAGSKTDAIRVPASTTANRPGSPANGMIRYNTDNNKLEAYINSGWQDLAGASTGGSFLSSGGGTLSGALTISSGGASITGGVNNNSGGITNAGSITGVGSNITGTGALTLAAGGTNTNLSLQPNGTGLVNVGDNLANYVTVKGATATNAPVIGTAGSDANVNLILSPKGTGNVGIGTTTPQGELHVHDSAGTTTEIRLTNNTTGATSTDGMYLRMGNSDLTIVNQENGYLALHNNGSERMRIDSSGNVGIGTTSPNASALVDMSSTSKGYLPPRMTTAQRDAITSPATGLTIYNTNYNQHEFYNGTGWVTMGGLPNGTIAAFASASCPAGWTEYLPARGRFLRGIDNGAGNDPSGTRAPGNTQADDNKSHNHGVTDPGHSHSIDTLVWTNSPSGGQNVQGFFPAGASWYASDHNSLIVSNTTGISIQSSGSESRPKNVAVTYCQYAGGTPTYTPPDISVLAGTTISSPSNGQTLVYNSTTSKWENQNLRPVAILAYEVGSGTNQGTGTAATWTTRPINTEVSDSDGIVSLAANQFTLQAGTYKVSASQCFYSDGNAQVSFKGRIRNVSDNTTVANGMTCRLHIAVGESAEDNCPVDGVFTIAAAKTFELQYYAQSFGSSFCSAASSGENERFVQVIIEKIK